MGMAMLNGTSAGRSGNAPGARMSGIMALLMAVVAAPGLALAQQPGLGQPAPRGMGLQQSASPIMDFIHFFHDGFLLPIITVICIFVAGLLGYCLIRFSEKRNPTKANRRSGLNPTSGSPWTLAGRHLYTRMGHT